MLQARQWVSDKYGRSSARVSLSIPGLTIRIPTKEVGKTIAAVVQQRIIARLDLGLDSDGKRLPAIVKATTGRRARRVKQFKGAGADWQKQARQQRRVARAWGRRGRIWLRDLLHSEEFGGGRLWGSDKWLADRFQPETGGRFSPDGKGTAGRESGYLAGQVKVTFRGYQGGEARFGIFFPSDRSTHGATWGRANYIRWAEARGARIVSVPADLDRDLETILRRFADAAVDQRRSSPITWREVMRSIGVAGRLAEQAVGWAFG